MAAGRPAGQSGQSGPEKAIGDQNDAVKGPSQDGNEAWDMAPFSLAFSGPPTPIAIPMFAPIPSPLGNFSGSSARLLNLVNERASTGVRELFNRVRLAMTEETETISLRARMLDGSLADREHGFVVYLERPKNYMAEQSQDTAADAELQSELVQNNHLIKL